MLDASNLAEFFDKSVIRQPVIYVSEKDYDEFLTLIENPPKPNPALILAMERARRKIKEREQKHETRD